MTVQINELIIRAEIVKREVKREEQPESYQDKSQKKLNEGKKKRER